MATVAAEVAAAAAAAAFFSDLTAFFSVLATTLGSAFCATRMFVPMNVGAFLGASPSSTAMAALWRHEGMNGTYTFFTYFMKVR